MICKMTVENVSVNKGAVIISEEKSDLKKCTYSWLCAKSEAKKSLAGKGLKDIQVLEQLKLQKHEYNDIMY